MNNDFFLELFNALLIAGIILYQIIKVRNTRLLDKPGTKLIFAGFCFMLFGACLDMTDEFPQLNHFVVIGDTPVEAFLEKFFGYMVGSILLLLGFSRILPVFAELDAKQQLIETIIETIPAPTFCKDEEGRYLVCNRDFEEFLGVDRDKIIGKTVYALSPRDLADKYHQFDQELLSQKGRQIYEAQVLAADGTHRDVVFHKAVFHKADGSAGGLVGVMLDISARKREEEGLRRLDRMKSEFISIAAHELRTPLTSVQGYSELLLNSEQADKFTDAQRHDFLHEIYQSGETLSRRIDELLDVGRIEQGRPLPLNMQSCQPEPLFQKVIAQFRLQNQSQQIEFESELSPEQVFLFDDQRLRQVVENLLSNAVKYSQEKKKITVSARIVGKHFKFEVSDQGTGMTPGQVEKMFDKFYRADESQNWISGLGIGMSIVKNIVDAHQGEIEVESQLGQGTRVLVSLPLTSV